MRLKNNQGSDELNLGDRSFRPDHRRAFWIPEKDVAPELLSVAGFYLAPLSKAEALQDVAGAVVAMPECREKAALGQASPIYLKTRQTHKPSSSVAIIFGGRVEAAGGGHWV